MKHTPPTTRKLPENGGRSIRVWDLPTRLVHWLLVVLVSACFVTVSIGGIWMPRHMQSGCVILGLLVFRIIWGFLGGRYARFSSFVRGPVAVFGYARDLLRRDTPKPVGHNPMGGWSVLAMLISLIIQAVTGLFANDDIFNKGPLYHWVGKATSDGLTRIHRLNQEVLLLLVGVHLIAVFFYLIIKHDNLILPMITGYKQGRATDQESANPLGLAMMVGMLTATGVYLLVR
jgi:cytochrome b